jgi:hypothetical protein
MTYNILRNVYANKEYRGRRGRIARRLRVIQGYMNDARSDAREERWKRRLFCVMNLSDFDIEDTQGTLIFVVTESMCDDAMQGNWSEEICDLGRDTYIALDNPLLARAFDV